MVKIPNVKIFTSYILVFSVFISTFSYLIKPVYAVSSIDSCEDLELINTDSDTLDEDYVLTGDIDCRSFGNDIILGSIADPFTGTFNGGGFFITVDIDDASDNIGLFSHTLGATITNLNIAGSVSGQNNTGSLIGNAVESVIENVGSIVEVSGSGNNIGGLIGVGVDISISQSYFSGSISSGSSQNIGGLIGSLESDTWTNIQTFIKESFSDTQVGGIVNIGGLAGLLTEATVSDSYSSGSVHGYDSVGGLVGKMDDSDVYTSYSESNVVGNGFIHTENNIAVGGFVGSMLNTSFVNDSFSLGEVSFFISLEDTSNTPPLGTTYYAGFAGYLNDHGPDDLINIYYDSINSGQDFCAMVNNLGTPTGVDLSGQCFAINTVGVPDEDYFKNNDTNPPLDVFNFPGTWEYFPLENPKLFNILDDDPAGPTFLNVSSTPSNNEALLEWELDDYSPFSSVEYGKNTSYGLTSDLDNPLPPGKLFSVNLTGLSECTDYHFLITSHDYFNNESTSGNQQFKTTGCSSSNGSGGYVKDLNMYLSIINGALNADQVAVLSSTSVKDDNFIFTRNLKLGRTGEDVKELQKFLNKNGFKVSESGFGSPGNETIYFGKKTQKALVEFQNYYKKEILEPLKLSKGTGIFGVQTMKFVNNFSL